MIRIIVFSITFLIRGLCVACRPKADLENLALCQQVMALEQERPKPLLHEVDRVFRVALRAAWAKRTVAISGWTRTHPTGSR